MAEAVSKVAIYRFRLYDISSDENRKSRRWATRETIESLGGEIIESSVVEVNASVVGAENMGMTARDFDPNAQIGF
jgi:hypothetical protein